MAKIQYIRSNVIEFESPSVSGVNAPAEKKSDPALRIILTFGIVGFMLAVVAMLVAITALQNRKDTLELFKASCNSRVKYAISYLGKDLTPDAKAKLESAFGIVKELHTNGSISDKRLSGFLDSVWEQITEKERSRALIVSLVRQARDLTPIPDESLEALAKQLEAAADADVIMSNVVNISNTGESPLFLPPSEFERPSGPTQPMEPTEPEIPPYSVE
jgi:hypothetical protein